MNSEKSESCASHLIDQENTQDIRQKKSVVQKRNPLSDLPGNVRILTRRSSLNIRKVHTLVSAVVVTKPTKVRSSSTSTLETKIRYCINSENITERENEDVAIDAEEVFVDGKEHYINYLPEKEKVVSTVCKSKVEIDFLETLPVVRSRCPSTEKFEPKKPCKVNLVRKISNRRKRNDVPEDTLYENCLYEEYMDENFFLMLQSEARFAYRKTLLKLNIDNNYRIVIVNWLSYAHQVFGLDEATYFRSIRMFDYVLTETRSSIDKYLLIAMVCMWITSKLFDTNVIKISKLYSICNGKFSCCQIMSTERNILKILNFEINFPEPSAFLFYYLKRENREGEAKIRCSAMFLLEVFTLLLDFSSLTPSLLACFALLMAYFKYGLDYGKFLEYVDDLLLDKEMAMRKVNQLKEYVADLLESKSVAKEVVSKYSTEEKHCVALDFLAK